MTATSATFARKHATALLLLLLVVAGGASAHANPDRAEPKVGATVSASPDQVRIWFDSDLEPAFSSIEVHAPDGAKVDDGHGHVDASDPKLLEVAVPRLPRGKYQVVWSVVARDGHRTAGNYRFTIK